MLGGSSTSTTGQIGSTSNNLEAMSASRTFPCNTCNLVFGDSQAQRTHMREPWHVYNLKQRIADLPPISADIYAETIATSLVASKQKSLHAESSSRLLKSPAEKERESDVIQYEDHHDQQFGVNSCLFCTRNLQTLDANLEHMSAEHGLYIPEIEHLSSLETTIEYLNTVIVEYNECLYCGITKQSAEGIRRHMLDRGHCMMNLEREPELLEFWELSGSDSSDADEERTIGPSAQNPDSSTLRFSGHNEYVLPSGKVLGSKSKARESRLLARRTAVKVAKEESKRTITSDLPNSADSNSPFDHPGSLVEVKEGAQNRTVARRDAAGLLGVSDQQIRSLVTVERKMQRQQQIVRASAAWADELGGTHQKHYKQKMNIRYG